MEESYVISVPFELFLWGQVSLFYTLTAKVDSTRLSSALSWLFLWHLKTFHFHIFPQQTCIEGLLCANGDGRY